MGGRGRGGKKLDAEDAEFASMAKELKIKMKPTKEPWWLRKQAEKKVAKANRVPPPRPTLWERPDEDMMDELNLEAKIVADLFCHGCSVRIQHEDPEAPGYTPPHLFEDQGVPHDPLESDPLYQESATVEEVVGGMAVTKEWKKFDPNAPRPKPARNTSQWVLCRRCFSLKNYGRESYMQDLAMSKIQQPMQLQNMVNDVVARKSQKKIRGLKNYKALILKVVDVFDFAGSFVDDAAEIVGDNDVIIVANKADLLPRDVSRPRLTEWIRQEAKARGLTTVRKVVFTRANSKAVGSGISDLINAINSFPPTNIYCIGCANVGKSSLLNAVATFCNAPFHTELTTSLLPGTTWSLVSIPIDFSRTLYDTPGLINKKSLLWQLNVEELRSIVPQRRIKPHTFFVKEGRSMLLGGLVRIDIAESNVLVTPFVSNRLIIHTTNTEKVEDFLAKHAGTPFLHPPASPERAQTMPPMVVHEFALDGAVLDRASLDVCIAGLGFVSFALNRTATARVHAPEGVDVTARAPLLPFDVQPIRVGRKRIRSVAR